jgi:peptidoglycan/xylan/chitin deacetylase (PgdA/CDA1 family)
VTAATNIGGFAWPDGARAAVSLTYDDALRSQLDNAVPVLDANGVRATFFLSQATRQFDALAARFSALLATGHELASHTVAHPCERELPGYTLERMGADLDQNIQTLRSMGAAGALTFAYPCGITTLGPSTVSYVPLVHERFLAARSTDWAIADPHTVDLDLVPSMGPDAAPTAARAIDLACQAQAAGGWLVLGFHGIGERAEYLPMPQAAHDELIRWLSRHAPSLWIAPFGTVAAHVVRSRRRAG